MSLDGVGADFGARLWQLLTSLCQVSEDRSNVFEQSVTEPRDVQRRLGAGTVLHSADGLLCKFERRDGCLCQG